MEDQIVVPPEGAVEPGQETPTETSTEQPPEGQEPIQEPASEPPIVPPPPKKNFQERIDEITRARREAEREREYWKKVALEREQRPPEPPSDTPQRPPRPTLDQFESTVEYEDALFEWRDRVKSLESAAARERVEQEAAFRTFNERARKVREENEDFDEVVESPVFSPTMRGVLLQSENGPEVAYFLGRPENRDQAEKIRNLPADRQAYEIGKLESNLLLAKKTRKVTGAPPPISPVGMGGGGKEKDPSEMNIDEWMAWDRERQKEKIKKKYGGQASV